MSDRVRTVLRHLLTLALAVFVVVATVSAPPPAEDRAMHIGSQIRCPVCQGESIADSPAALAGDMMDLVRARIDQGWSDQQIIDELVASYSGAQLLDPPFSITTAALWAVPGLVLLLGAAAALGRRRPHPPDVPSDDPVEGDRAGAP